ncbi:calcium-binding protein [Novosphingobium huizhouense]|uniref:calcium-binding protein n=1 Tax=Novosphingobium huizhouense TaxID=2866625 RepID=UPI001CD88E7B|nr:calcium-binding protein [Novosphingobium huizhouense]
MAIVNSGASIGETWSNVLDAEVVADFQFGQTAAPALLDKGGQLAFTFGADQIVFSALNTFTLAPPAGTIAGFESADTVASGLSVGLAEFFAMVRDGDVDALNAVVWAGADTINGGASDDLIRGFGGGDTLFGNDGNDSLLGDGGSDRLYGGNGNDVLSGGANADRLQGQVGNDRLSGGSGNDQLTGGAGFDRMVGGSGADTFLWKATSEFAGRLPNASFAVDIVLDFSHADGDRLDVSGVDANDGLAGNQTFAFIGSDPFAADAAGQIRVAATDNANVFLVQLNTDTDAQAEASFLVVSPAGAPVAADFVL